MNTRISTDACPVGNLYVSGERSAVCHNNFAANLTVVCDVSLGHEEIVVSDLCKTAAAGCSAVDRNKFAYVIAPSDGGGGRFARVL